jgi:hypothetical protein
MRGLGCEKHAKLELYATIHPRGYEEGRDAKGKRWYYLAVG